MTRDTLSENKTYFSSYATNSRSPLAISQRFTRNSVQACCNPEPDQKSKLFLTLPESIQQGAQVLVSLR